MDHDIQFEIILEQPFHQALEAVEIALRNLGFTIITRIDVQRMMKDNLNVDFYPYIILGACDSTIASRALEIDPSLGLMLPCNVAIESHDNGGTWVRVTDPTASLSCHAAENSQLAELALEAGRRMSEVITFLRMYARPTAPEAKPWDRLNLANLE